jgi:hypothetical protein
MRNTHVRPALARVNTNQNGIYMECFIDEWRRRPARTRSSSAALMSPSQAPRGA